MNAKLTLTLLGLTCAGAIALGVYLTRQQAPELLASTLSASGPEERETATGAKVYSGRKSGGPAESGAGSLLRRMMEGDVPKPTLAQLDLYLQENRRSAHSLLAAAQVTQDRALLHEAMRQYPNDPLVQYAAYFFATDYDSEAVATPERRKWLEALKTSEPDNALPGLLSARDYFKAGQTDKAIEELRNASAKTQFNDHAFEYIQNAEEAYLAAGEPEVSAKAAAMFALPLPHLAQLRDLSRSIVDLAQSYSQAGDNASAAAALQYGLGMTDHMGTGQKCLIQDLVAVAVERNILSAMEPSAGYGDSGQTVQERLAQLNQRRDSLKEIGQKSGAVMKLMSEQDMVSYIDRWKMFGEESALRWAAVKYGN